MGKWRASKYQRAAAAETNNKNSKKTKETYAEIVYENAAFEEYYKVSLGGSSSPTSFPSFREH